ncbi:MAG: zf-TFIIB domain-containing protein [Actinomycetota bacterium]|nr:zf-TFIIB domain-containing protein [Actinomycetota bacterium]
MQLLCPKCHNIMAQYERNRVLVDQCTECKGIFLDRGELENLVEAEKAYYGSPMAASSAPAGDRPGERPAARAYDERRFAERGYDDRRYEDRRYEDRRYHGDSREDRPYRKKKRSSMLEELFDF